ncbi:hypothetical protein [Azospirillum brasilense]|uniref:Uncharacterized protein n=1 Tax=Azospirillum brasilense TaxID=192 RepID=A0A6L3ARP2_AZOBR|nr:hypothetical protein [Azospirillum brasilense]KAA0677015.1 hypothetical protein DS837_30045 [Azospirillum brasilense]
MTQLLDFQVAAVALAATLATIAIWAPRRLWVKVSAVAVSIGFMPVAYAGMADLLSKPKPVRMEWAQSAAAQATILGAQIKEGQGIYLWLQLEGGAEPRYYKLAWDQTLAEQLQQAMREAEKNRSGMAMTLPFENTLDPDKPKFYALPQPQLPEKNGEEGGPGPMVYRHPGMDA